MFSDLASREKREGKKERQGGGEKGLDKAKQCREYVAKDIRGYRKSCSECCVRHEDGT